MLDKLEQIVSRYEELTQELSSPELLSNPSAYAKAAKQHRTLGEVVQKYQTWKSLKAQLTDTRELRQWTNSAKTEHTPRWSPDGKTLAFLSDREDNTQIWTMPANGGRHGASTREQSRGSSRFVALVA